MAEQIYLHARSFSWRRGAFFALLLSLSLITAGCQPGETPAAATPVETTPPAATATPENTEVVPSSTPQPTSTPEPSPTFDISSVSDWGSGRLLFDIEERDFGEINFLGIFAVDLLSGEASEISSPGTQLLAISPDHKRFLAAREGTLLVVDLASGSEQILAEDYFHLSPSGAKWDASTNTIYYTAYDGSAYYLVRANPDRGTVERLPFSSPVSVLEADQGVLIWAMGSCNPFGDCTYSNLVWSDEAGNEVKNIELGDTVLLPCQRPDDFTFSVKDENDALSLHILSHDQAQEAVFWSVNTEYSDCSWAPDGSQLAVTLVDRFWYSGSIQNYYFQILVPATNQIFDLSYLKAPLDSVAWSPDGKYTVFTGTELVNDSYQLQINLVELANFTVTKINQLEQFKSANYRAVHKLFWTP